MAEWYDIQTVGERRADARSAGRAETIRRLEAENERLKAERFEYRLLAARLYQMDEATGPCPENVSDAEAFEYVDKEVKGGE